jgi:hypothetical protein
MNALSAGDLIIVSSPAMAAALMSRRRRHLAACSSRYWRPAFGRWVR